MKPWAATLAAARRDPAGVAAVLDAGTAAGVSRSELAWVIERESGWRPAAAAQTSTARGLMQWMEGTRRSLGLDPLGRTIASQADAVATYLHALRPPPGRLYVGMVSPAAMGQPPEHVIYPVGSAAWVQNPGLRDGPGGPITVASVIARGTPPSPLPDLPRPPPGGSASSPRGRVGAGAGLVAILVIAYLALQKTARRVLTAAGEGRGNASATQSYI